MKSFFVALMCVPLLTACAPNLTSIVYFERQQPSSKKIELLEQAIATYDEDDFQWQMNHPSGKVLPCYSPLDCAIYTGDLEVARFLLERGALPDLKPMIGVGDAADKTNYLIQNVVLRAETDSEAATALALLLEHGANPAEKRRDPALQELRRSSRIESFLSCQIRSHAGVLCAAGVCRFKGPRRRRNGSGDPVPASEVRRRPFRHGIYVA